MIIQVNFREMECDKGLTIEALLVTMKEDEKNRYFLIGAPTVIVNNEVILVSDYPVFQLLDGDQVRIYPIIAGG